MVWLVCEVIDVGESGDVGVIDGSEFGLLDTVSDI